MSEQVCRIVGPYFPVGDIDWECRTHNVLAELRDPSKAGDIIRRDDLFCPVGMSNRPRMTATPLSMWMSAEAADITDDCPIGDELAAKYGLDGAAT